MSAEESAGGIVASEVGYLKSQLIPQSVSTILSQSLMEVELLVSVDGEMKSEGLSSLGILRLRDLLFRPPPYRSTSTKRLHHAMQDTNDPLEQ